MQLFSLLLLISATIHIESAPQLGNVNIGSMTKFKDDGRPAAPGRYVVRFRPKATTSPIDMQRRVRSIDMTLDINSWHGLSGKFSVQDLGYFNSHPDVSDIYPDYIIEGAALTASDLRKQTNPKNAGMVRISHRRADGYKDFIFPKTAGAGVIVYVLDTGVQADVNDFEGRVIHGVSTLPFLVNDPGLDGYYDDPFVDLNGHGTNVAGVIGGRVYGVAKKVFISSVKVLYANFEGTLSTVAKGIEFVEQQAAETGTPSLMNLSLTALARFDAFDLLIQATRVPMFTAAGNGVNVAAETGLLPTLPNGKPSLVPYDACKVTPAGTPGMFAVASIDARDKPSYFSNYGRCVKLYAPGENIFSDIPFDVLPPSIPFANNRTGTSQATAFVSGIAAIYMSLCSGMVSRRNLYFALLKYSTKNMVGNVAPGTPNRIAYIFPSADYFTWCGNSTARLA